MCLGIPGRVVELSAENADLATVDVSGVKRTVNIGLLHEDGGVRPGQWVLLHVGFAMTTLTADEVALALQSLQMMTEGQVDEIEAELPSRRAGRGGRTYEREEPPWAS